MSQDVGKFQAEGIQFIIGLLKGETVTTVQSILFDKTSWNSADAKTWLGDHEFKATKLDETEDKLRFRQQSPNDFEDGSLRTIPAGTHKRKRELLQEYLDEMEKSATMSGAIYSTTEDEFHIHYFAPSAAVTEPPVGVPEGHRHEITRNAEGKVTGFSESAGHGHGVDPEMAKFLIGNGDSEYPNYAKSSLHEIKGVEIFRTGVWNKDKYTQKDLDDMVKAFDKVGFPVPLKLGHMDTSGGPAFGWVRALRREGQKLIADFIDVPKQLFDMIKQRRFDTVSAEIFWNLVRNGKTFRRVLKAVALLGAETPGVSNLAPLRDVVLIVPEDDFDQVLSYSLHPEEWNMDKIEELTTKVESLQKNLDEAEEARKVAETRAVEAEVKGKGTGTEEAAAKLKEAEEAAEELTQELADAKKALGNEARDNAATIKALGTKVQSLEGRIAEQEEEKRQELIQKGADECKLAVIRPHVKALYDIATTTEKQVNFKEGDKEVELSAKEIVDSLVAELNKYVVKLFTELGRVDELQHEAGDYTDPSAEVHERAIKHMTEKKIENTPGNLATAVKAVLSADPELQSAYAGTSSSVN